MQPPRPSPTRMLANVARILAAATTIALLTGCASPGVIARIGTTTITQAETQHWTTAITKAGNTGGAQGSAMTRAVGLLLLARWLAGEAQELGLNVSSVAASRQLELLRFEQRGGSGAGYEALPRDPQLRGLLLSPRLAERDQMWLMRLSLLAGKVEHARLQRAEREVPQAQVKAFYRRHARRFLLPERRSLEVIGSQSRGVVVRAKREIEHGRPFLELARRISVDGEAPEGLEELIRGTDEIEFETPVFAAKPHVLLGPNKYRLYYIFKVLKSTPARQQTLTEAEPKIRHEIILAQPAATLTAAFEAKWKARSRCSPLYHSPRCVRHQ